MESVFVIERSAVGTEIASVSVAVLFARLGSVTPAGAVTVAVFVRGPVAFAAIVETAVNVAVPPTGSVTWEFILPVPFAVPQVPPAPPVHVHDTDEIPPGKVSVTVAPTTASGPALDATIVYVTVPPGV